MKLKNISWSVLVGCIVFGLAGCHTAQQKTSAVASRGENMTLTEAINNNDLNAFEKILAAGADVNVCKQKGTPTPLMLTAPPVSSRPSARAMQEPSSCSAERLESMP